MHKYINKVSLKAPPTPGVVLTYTTASRALIYIHIYTRTHTRTGCLHTAAAPPPSVATQPDANRAALVRTLAATVNITASRSSLAHCSTPSDRPADCRASGDARWVRPTVY